MNPPVDISQVILYTERLTLRAWQPDDLDDLYAVTARDGVGQMLGWTPHTRIGQAKEMLEGLIRNSTAFAVIYEGRAVGSLGIPRYSETNFPEFKDRRCRELSFFLSPDYWGRGLIPEAVKEVLRWLFTDVGLDAVFCGHFVFNVRSAHVQRKLGFRPVRITRYTTKNGTVEDNQVNLMTRDEWMAMQAGEKSQ